MSWYLYVEFRAGNKVRSVEARAELADDKSALTWAQSFAPAAGAASLFRGRRLLAYTDASTGEWVVD